MSMVPDPSESNKSKASLISCFCSSVNSGLTAVFLLLVALADFLKLLAFKTKFGIIYMIIKIKDKKLNNKISTRNINHVKVNRLKSKK